MENDPLNLDEKGEWAGEWWLPEAQDKKMPGVLRYDPDHGLSLTLICGFNDRITSPTPSGEVGVQEGRRTWDVIRGTAEQHSITLLDCYPTKSELNGLGCLLDPDKQAIGKQTIGVGTALIGAWVSDEDEAAFSAAEVSVEELSRWGASSILEEKFGTTDGCPDGSGVISVDPVPGQKVSVNETTYTLKHRCTWHLRDYLRGSTVISVRDTTFVRVDPAKCCSLNDAKDFAHLVQDLIALATHRAAGVIWLRLKKSTEDAGDQQEGAGRGESRDRNVDVIYSPSKVGSHDGKAVQSGHVLFTCKDLPFKEIIPRWCEVHERLRPALNMILGLRYAPAQYIENNLLMVVGAAEVLHRGLRIDEPPMPDKDFKPMREEMLKHVPEEHKARIKGLLRNGPTLRERLHALADLPDQKAMSSLVPEVERWVQRTTKARNDLAHEGQTPNHSFEELIAIVDVTTAVVILNLLNEVGLSAEQQRKIIRNNPQLREAARQASDLLRSPDKREE